MLSHPHRDDMQSRILAAFRSLRPATDAESFVAFGEAVLANSRMVAFTGRNPDQVALMVRALWETAHQSGGALKVQWHEGEKGLLITTAMPDQVFIVDTIRKALRAAGVGRLVGFHTVLPLNRSAGLRVGGNADPVESVTCFEVEALEASDGDALVADLTARLSLATLVVKDFEAVRAQVQDAIAKLEETKSEESAEGADFLRWTLGDNFVFLGATATSGGQTVALGADRSYGALWAPAENRPSSSVVAVRKEKLESPIHRNGRVDAVRVSVGGSTYIFRGMFTHRALTQPCRNLPILRKLLERVLAETESRTSSHRYRGLANVFDAMPTEWLFSASPAQVREVLDRVFDAEQDHSSQVHLQQEDDTTFAIIAMPERRYGDSVRARLLHRLTELTGATYTDSSLFAGRFDTVLLQVFQTGTKRISDEGIATFRDFVTEIGTPFVDRLAAVVEGDDQETVARYGDAFESEYCDHTPLPLLAQDIQLLELTRKSGRTLARLQQSGSELLLRVYQNHDIILSELLPILDHFGLVIEQQEAIDVHPTGLPAQQTDSFEVARVPGVSDEDVRARAELLVDGLEAVFEKHIASDPFNRLILTAGLTWQEADLVRGLMGYGRQIVLRQTYARIQEILLKNAALTAATVRWFVAKFDPDLPGDRAAIAQARGEEVLQLLKGVQTADEDQVMRTLQNLVDAMLRTNFYRTDRKCHYISFKFDHGKVRILPAPRMWREIYVHHREVEGLHLRGGPIARGGIRFSDRADFRTEILGLVTTQMVKNVVIVPEGSKGGFYIKYTIDDPKERRRKGDELYQILMRGMLDITDNIVQGKTVGPARVVAHDAQDPYLVVAADKGTAHLSDTANKLSLEYGFWLGDAFASGGSNGYDHKVVGITARGAWVLVRRHFRELGLDPEKDSFTCFGVGDCGGDVFGNGVIEHRNMKLQAAFNHAHIFFDPNPDTATSYEERRRLFDEVRGWDAYNTALLSKGGGIFDRRAKSIPLSPEVKAMLGTLADEVSPEQAMNLILKMNVDLFWNGGIGTYVRATHESNADANDPPNDDCRVTATELRCKVVGEGGNLGFTQAARVEYALAGGRLNTDFVDNSGGVDTSDHEVNLKILLNPMVASGRITLQDRNDFLRTLTDEVANAVLEDCNANGRLISLDTVRSQLDPLPFSRSIDWLCARGNVTRRFLVLPSEDDLKRRVASRQGLTRPELAVIQAHLKMHLFKMLMAEDPSVIPGFDRLLQGYFPSAVRSRFGADLPGHMLAKAIGMTVLLTEVATDAGCNYFPQMMDLTGASAGRIAGAWRSAMGLVEGDALKAELLGSKPKPDGAHRAWVAFTDGVQNLVANWLAPGATGQEDPARFQEALAALAGTRTSGDQALYRSTVERLAARGVPVDLCERILNHADAAAASEVAAIAAARGEAVSLTALRYQAVGAATRLAPTIRAIAGRRGGGSWDPVAIGILRLRYQALLRDLTLRNQASSELTLGVDRAAEAMATGQLANVARVVERIVGDSPDVAALLVGEQQIRALLA